MKTVLLLIRHGQSMANLHDIYAGHTDVDLSEKGFKQAEKTAEYIYSNYKVDKVYASDLRRAFKTADAVSRKFGLKTISDENLREIFAGKWENLPFVRLTELYKEDYAKWLHDIGNAGCTGGETVRQLAERIYAELEKIAQENPGKTVAIGTHATPIRAMQCLWSGKRIESMNDVPWVTNASVTVAEYENGSFRLIRAGIDEHIAVFKTELPQNV